MNFFSPSEDFEFGERKEGVTHQQMNQKDLPKHTHTHKSTASRFMKISFFFSKIKEVIFHWEPIISVLLWSVIYWSQPLPGKHVPRSGQHRFRLCTSCGGYMKSRNYFCLVSSSLWRSGALEVSDHCKVFSPRCEAPHPRQWAACLTLLLTYPRGKQNMGSHSHREITEVECSGETSTWAPLCRIKQGPAVSDTRDDEMNWKSRHETQT